MISNIASLPAIAAPLLAYLVALGGLQQPAIKITVPPPQLNVTCITECRVEPFSCVHERYLIVGLFALNLGLVLVLVLLTASACRRRTVASPAAPAHGKFIANR